MSDGIRVNGNAYSWGSVKFQLDTERYYQINEVTYSDKRTRTQFWGMGTHQTPTARSRGKYEMENIKLKCLKETGALIRAQLSLLSNANNGGNSYGDIEIPILLQYAEIKADGSLKMTEVSFVECAYVGTSETNTEGPEVLVEELEFQPMQILRDGLPLYSDIPDAGE